jgi:hypothetical protein
MSKQLHNGHLHKDRDGKVWVMTPPYIKSYKDKMEVAKIFLFLVCSFNNIKLGPMELEFLGFMMLRDGVVTVGKKLYCEQYGRTMSRVDNIISLLKKKKILVKIDNKVRIHPKIVVGFKEHDNFIFQFKCQKQQTT